MHDPDYQLIISVNKVPQQIRMNGKVPQQIYRSVERKSDLHVFPKKASRVSSKTNKTNKTFERYLTLGDDIESSSTINNKLQSTQEQIHKNYTESSTKVVNDIISVLKQENTNLKDQNTFLLEKLRALASRQQQHRKRAKVNQRVSKQLRAQNQQIRYQIQQINRLTNNKIQQLGRKLILLSNSDSEDNKKRSQQCIGQPEIFKNVMQSKSELINNHSNYNGGLSPNIKESITAKLNNKFQNLLQECKQERDPDRKKQLRRKLLEISNKMKQLRK